MCSVLNIENTITFEKSKFITSLFYIENEQDITKYMNLVKEKYKNATHYCYAYIIGNIKRFSDDKEPSNTAGMPILNCLEKNNLNHILCIVTRYFGGIKLGCGGLTRAYSNSCTEALAKSTKVELINGYNIYIYTYYDKVNVIDRILENSEILSKEFGNNVVYNTKVDKNILDILDNMNIDYKIINECIIKRLT